MGGKRWSEEEKELLKCLYPSENKDAILEQLPGRSWVAIYGMVQKIGVKRIDWHWKNAAAKVVFCCEQCNEVVKRFPNPNNGNRFCSRSCYHTWQREHPEENYFHKHPRVGELNSNWGRHPNHRKAIDMRKLSVLGRLAQGPHKATKPEQALYTILGSFGIQFEAQKYIGSYCVDALILPNIIIEVDGEYWHNYPHGKAGDKRRDMELKEKGYIVYRYWAKEILNNGQEVLKWLIV